MPLWQPPTACAIVLGKSFSHTRKSVLFIYRWKAMKRNELSVGMQIA